MNSDYTDNRGFADWHARNHENIPSGVMMRMSPPPDDAIGAIRDEDALVRVLRNANAT